MSIMTRDLMAAEIAEYGVSVGEHSYGAPIVKRWGVDGDLVIGRYCSFGQEVEILLGGNHRMDWVTTYPFTALWPEGQGIGGHPTNRGPVTIGNDVWLGAHVTLLSGATIGDGAVLATKAVIAGTVPPYAIVGGNPAKVIRKRFTDEQIADLLEIAWWNWPDEEVRPMVPLLVSNRIDEFIARAKERLGVPPRSEPTVDAPLAG